MRLPHQLKPWLRGGAAALLSATLWACAPDAAPKPAEIDDDTANFLHVKYQPLLPEFRDNWFIARGDWSLTEREISGAGDAQMDLNGPFYTPLLFRCALSAAPGSRPRIVFGNAFELAGDPAPDGQGLLLTLRALPDGAASASCRVGYGKASALKVLVKELETGLFVDGAAAVQLERGAGCIEVIKFSAGDIDHPGKATFGGVQLNQ